MQSEVSSIAIIGANAKTKTKSSLKKSFGTQTNFDRTDFGLKFAESGLLEQVFEYPSEQEMLDRETGKLISVQ